MNNPKLKFNVLTSVDTGELIGSKKAYYNGLEFTIEPKGKVKIKGSIHKYYNEGLHNGDRFSFDDFLKAVSLLSEFGVIPDKAMLRGFEIGLNLDTAKSKIDTKVFLDSILYCRGVEGADMEINGKSGYGYRYKTTNTTYKFYDKMEQACLQSERLRIETKFTKMRAVESFHIRTLADLMNKEKLSKLIAAKYLRFIDETIFFEWNQIKTPRRLPKKYKDKFRDLRNPDWWIKDERCRKERNQNKKLLEKLIDKYAKRNIKNILKDLILLELQEFSRSKKGYRYTEFESLFFPSINNTKNAEKKVTNTPCIVWCESTDQGEVKKEKIYCEVCGKEITHQRKGSRYCSHNRKCRDTAYNLKISEKRKNKRLKQEKEITKIIKEIGSQLQLVRTTNPKSKRNHPRGKPMRRTSIVVSANGRKRYFHGSAARYFIQEFEKKAETNDINPKNKLKRA
ncbi:hypothetical protein [Marinifilum sp. D737]|uniref:hypothetical protein n=1 Tax=Marinifilum sp. D737 TaxID=2969628 RepID=UPI0022753070|nr:hypothetical protein [Marinifilum sp. D737]MCY1634396.1 hypothetical protein [Marinifilum sp. D737]